MIARPAKKAMELRININEQIVSRIIDAVVKAIAQPTPDVSNGQSAQLEALQKKVASLQDELARMRAQQPKPVAQPTISQPKPMPTQPIALQSGTPKPMPTEQVQTRTPIEKPQAHSVEPTKPLQSAQPATHQAKPNEVQSYAKPNGNGNQPDEEKAEKWVRENLLEWLDQPCPFAKAGGRSWKQLSKNEGEKIVIRGKPMPPRAYLHTLENWNECKAWAKLKAKVALEFGKNGN